MFKHIGYRVSELVFRLLRILVVAALAGYAAYATEGRFWPFLGALGGYLVIWTGIYFVMTVVWRPRYTADHFRSSLWRLTRIPFLMAVAAIAHPVYYGPTGGAAKLALVLAVVLGVSAVLLMLLQGAFEVIVSSARESWGYTRRDAAIDRLIKDGLLLKPRTWVMTRTQLKAVLKERRD